MTIINMCNMNVKGSFYCMGGTGTFNQDACSFMEPVPSEIFEKLSEHNRNCYKCRYLYDESRWYTDGYYCRCKEAIDHSKESIDADKKLIKSLSYNSGV